MPVWNPLVAMPAGHEFEVYHPTDDNWHSVIFHSHPFYEFYIFLRGGVHIMVEEQLFEDVQPYDLFIFPPGYMHQNIPALTGGSYTRAYFYITESFLRGMSQPECDLSELVSLVTEHKRFHFRLGEERCLPLLRQMDELIGAQGALRPADQLINRCRMAILVAALCQAAVDLPRDGAVAANNRAAKVMRYINRHVTEPVSLDGLAEHFFISKYHLAREFKQYTGSSIHQYILEKRVVYAQLLMQRGVPPAEAAEECGFSDYTGFFRAFKTRTGHSPQEYVKVLSGRAAP